MGLLLFILIIDDNVDDFVRDAEQFDDLTMLCLEYKGKTQQPDKGKNR